MTDEEIRGITKVTYLIECSLHIDGDTIVINPNFISTLTIMNDYENWHLPVIKLTLNLASETYYRVIGGADRLKVRLKLVKEITMQGVATRKAKSFHKVFKTYLEDKRPFLEAKTVKETGESSTANAGIDESVDESATASTEIDLYLVSGDNNRNNNICNFVLSSSNMTDAVGVVLGEAGYEKILMQPLDNKDSYSQVLIPPYTTLGNLKYLNSQYGFYQTGYIFYAGIDRVYMLSKDKGCKAREADEYKKVVIIVGEEQSLNQFKDASIDDDEKKIHYIRVPPTSFSAKNLSMNTNAIEGNDKLFVYPKTGAKIKAKEGINHLDKPMRQILSNNYNNKYVGTETEARITSKNTVISLPVTNIDMDFITPNKEYILKFDDTDAQKLLGGKYRIVASSFAFGKVSEDQFLLDGNITIVS